MQSVVRGVWTLSTQLCMHAHDVHVHTHTHTCTYIPLWKIYKRKPYLQLAAVVWLILKVNLNSFKNHWNLGLHYTEIANHCPEGRNSLAVWFSLWNISKWSFRAEYTFRYVNPQSSLGTRARVLIPRVCNGLLPSWGPTTKGAPPSQRDGTRQRKIGIDCERVFLHIKSWVSVESFNYFHTIHSCIHIYVQNKRC